MNLDIVTHTVWAKEQEPYRSYAESAYYNGVTLMMTMRVTDFRVICVSLRIFLYANYYTILLPFSSSFPIL